MVDLSVFDQFRRQRLFHEPIVPHVPHVFPSVGNMGEGHIMHEDQRLSDLVPHVPPVPLQNNDAGEFSEKNSQAEEALKEGGTYSVEDAEERAAVLEYDEGLSRDEAEYVAHAAPSQVGPAADPKALPKALARLPSSRASLLRPVGWMPEAGPGVTISKPAVEVSATVYDAHLDGLLRGLPPKSDAAGRLRAARQKGSVVPRGKEMIFTKGRA